MNEINNPYLIKKITCESTLQWEDISPVEIAHYPWDETGFRPKAFARACYTDRALFVRLNAIEPRLRAMYSSMNEPVYTDSCLEFFLRPDPERDSRYLNFEINPLGTLLLGLGSERNGRELLTPEQTTRLDICTHTSKAPGGREWGFELYIPFVFLRSLFPSFQAASGKEMQGNFYKCGDSTDIPHYGCWNNIALESPDFHCPAFFGTFVLE